MIPSVFCRMKAKQKLCQRLVLLVVIFSSFADGHRRRNLPGRWGFRGPTGAGSWDVKASPSNDSPQEGPQLNSHAAEEPSPSSLGTSEPPKLVDVGTKEGEVFSDATRADERRHVRIFPLRRSNTGEQNSTRHKENKYSKIGDRLNGLFHFNWGSGKNKTIEEFTNGMPRINRTSEWGSITNKKLHNVTNNVPNARNVTFLTNNNDYKLNVKTPPSWTSSKGDNEQNVYTNLTEVRKSGKETTNFLLDENKSAQKPETPRDQDHYDTSSEENIAPESVTMKTASQNNNSESIEGSPVGVGRHALSFSTKRRFGNLRKPLVNEQNSKIPLLKGGSQQNKLWDWKEGDQQNLNRNQILNDFKKSGMVGETSNFLLDENKSALKPEKPRDQDHYDTVSEENIAPESVTMKTASQNNNSESIEGSPVGVGRHALSFSTKRRFGNLRKPLVNEQNSKIPLLKGGSQQNQLWDWKEGDQQNLNRNQILNDFKKSGRVGETSNFLLDENKSALKPEKPRDQDHYDTVSEENIAPESVTMKTASQNNNSESIEGSPVGVDRRTLSFSTKIRFGNLRKPLVKEENNKIPLLKGGSQQNKLWDWKEGDQQNLNRNQILNDFKKSGRVGETSNFLLDENKSALKPEKPRDQDHYDTVSEENIAPESVTMKTASQNNNSESIEGSPVGVDRRTLSFSTKRRLGNLRKPLVKEENNKIPLLKGGSQQNQLWDWEEGDQQNLDRNQILNDFKKSGRVGETTNFLLDENKSALKPEKPRDQDHYDNVSEENIAPESVTMKTASQNNNSESIEGSPVGVDRRTLSFSTKIRFGNLRKPLVKEENNKIPLLKGGSQQNQLWDWEEGDQQNLDRNQILNDFKKSGRVGETTNFLLDENKSALKPEKPRDQDHYDTVSEENIAPESVTMKTASQNNNSESIEGSPVGVDRRTLSFSTKRRLGNLRKPLVKAQNSKIPLLKGGSQQNQLWDWKEGDQQSLDRNKILNDFKKSGRSFVTSNTLDEQNSAPDFEQWKTENNYINNYSDEDYTNFDSSTYPEKVFLPEHEEFHNSNSNVATKQNEPLKQEYSNSENIVSLDFPEIPTLLRELQGDQHSLSSVNNERGLNLRTSSPRNILIRSKWANKDHDIDYDKIHSSAQKTQEEGYDENPDTYTLKGSTVAEEEVGHAQNNIYSSLLEGHDNPGRLSEKNVNDEERTASEPNLLWNRGSSLNTPGGEPGTEKPLHQEHNPSIINPQLMRRWNGNEEIHDIPSLEGQGRRTSISEAKNINTTWVPGSSIPKTGKSFVGTRPNGWIHEETKFRTEAEGVKNPKEISGLDNKFLDCKVINSPEPENNKDEAQPNEDMLSSWNRLSSRNWNIPNSDVQKLPQGTVSEFIPVYSKERIELPYENSKNCDWPQGDINTKPPGEWSQGERNVRHKLNIVGEVPESHLEESNKNPALVFGGNNPGLRRNGHGLTTGVLRSDDGVNNGIPFADTKLNWDEWFPKERYGLPDEKWKSNDQINPISQKPVPEEDANTSETSTKVKPIFRNHNGIDTNYEDTPSRRWTPSDGGEKKTNGSWWLQNAAPRSKWSAGNHHTDYDEANPSSVLGQSGLTDKVQPKDNKSFLQNGRGVFSRNPLVGDNGKPETTTGRGNLFEPSSNVVTPHSEEPSRANLGAGWNWSSGDFLPEVVDDTQRRGYTHNNVGKEEPNAMEYNSPDHNENYSPTFPRRLTPKNGPKGVSDEDLMKTESWPSWNTALSTRKKLVGSDITDDTYYDWPQGDINTKPPGEWSQGERNVQRKPNISGDIPESHLEENTKTPALVPGGKNPGIRRNGHGLTTGVLQSDDGVNNGIPFADTKLHWDEWFPKQRYGLPDEKWESNDQTNSFSENPGPDEGANTSKTTTKVEPIFGNHNGILTNYVDTPSRYWTPSDGGEEKTNESWWLQNSAPRSKWSAGDHHADYDGTNPSSVLGQAGFNNKVQPKDKKNFLQNGRGVFSRNPLVGDNGKPETTTGRGNLFEPSSNVVTPHSEEPSRANLGAGWNWSSGDFLPEVVDDTQRRGYTHNNVGKEEPNAMEYNSPDHNENYSPTFPRRLTPKNGPKGVSDEDLMKTESWPSWNTALSTRKKLVGSDVTDDTYYDWPQGDINTKPPGEWSQGERNVQRKPNISGDVPESHLEENTKTPALVPGGNNPGIRRSAHGLTTGVLPTDDSVNNGIPFADTELHWDEWFPKQRYGLPDEKWESNDQTNSFSENPGPDEGANTSKTINEVKPIFGNHNGIDTNYVDTPSRHWTPSDGGEEKTNESWWLQNSAPRSKWSAGDHHADYDGTNPSSVLGQPGFNNKVQPKDNKSFLQNGRGVFSRNPLVGDNGKPETTTGRGNLFEPSSNVVTPHSEEPSRANLGAGWNWSSGDFLPEVVDDTQRRGYTHNNVGKEEPNAMEYNSPDHNENYSPTFPRRLTPKNGPKGVSDEDLMKTESWPSWNTALSTRKKLVGSDVTDDTYYDWPQGDINTKPPGEWSQGERNVQRKPNISGDIPESHLEENTKTPALVPGGNNPGIRRNGHGLTTGVLPTDDSVNNGIPFADTKLHWNEWFPKQRYGLVDEKWESNDQTNSFSENPGPDEGANTSKTTNKVKPIFGNHNGIDTNYVDTPSRHWTPSDGGEEKTNESWWLQNSAPRSKWSAADHHADYDGTNPSSVLGQPGFNNKVQPKDNKSFLQNGRGVFSRNPLVGDNGKPETTTGRGNLFEPSSNVVTPHSEEPSRANLGAGWNWSSGDFLPEVVDDTQRRGYTHNNVGKEEPNAMEYNSPDHNENYSPTFPRRLTPKNGPKGVSDEDWMKTESWPSWNTALSTRKKLVGSDVTDDTYYDWPQGDINTKPPGEWSQGERNVQRKPNISGDIPESHLEENTKTPALVPGGNNPGIRRNGHGLTTGVLPTDDSVNNGIPFADTKLHWNEWFPKQRYGLVDEKWESNDQTNSFSENPGPDEGANTSKTTNKVKPIFGNHNGIDTNYVDTPSRHWTPSDGGEEKTNESWWLQNSAPRSKWSAGDHHADYDGTNPSSVLGQPGFNNKVQPKDNKNFLQNGRGVFSQNPLVGDNGKPETTTGRGNLFEPSSNVVTPHSEEPSRANLGAGWNWSSGDFLPEGDDDTQRRGYTHNNVGKEEPNAMEYNSPDHNEYHSPSFPRRLTPKNGPKGISDEDWIKTESWPSWNTLPSTRNKLGGSDITDDTYYDWPQGDINTKPPGEWSQGERNVRSKQNIVDEVPKSHLEESNKKPALVPGGNNPGIRRNGHGLRTGVLPSDDGKTNGIPFADTKIHWVEWFPKQRYGLPDEKWKSNDQTNPFSQKRGPEEEANTSKISTAVETIFGNHNGIDTNYVDTPSRRWTPSDGGEEKTNESWWLQHSVPRSKWNTEDQHTDYDGAKHSAVLGQAGFNVKVQPKDNKNFLQNGRGVFSQNPLVGDNGKPETTTGRGNLFEPSSNVVTPHSEEPSRANLGAGWNWSSGDFLPEGDDDTQRRGYTHNNVGKEEPNAMEYNSPDHNENYSPTFPRRLTPKNGPKGVSDEDWMKTESWPSWNTAPSTRSKLGGSDVTDDTYYDWPQGDINTKPPGEWSQGERNVQRKPNISGDVPESHLEENTKTPALVPGGKNPGIRRNGHGLTTGVLPTDDSVNNGIPFADTKLHWDEWFTKQRYGLPDEKWESNDQTNSFSENPGPDEGANTSKTTTKVEPIFGNHNGIDTNYVDTPSRHWTPSDGGEEKTNESWWLQHSVPRSKWNTEDQHTDYDGAKHSAVLGQAGFNVKVQPKDNKNFLQNGRGVFSRNPLVGDNGKPETTTGRGNLFEPSSNVVTPHSEEPSRANLGAGWNWSSGDFLPEGDDDTQRRGYTHNNVGKEEPNAMEYNSPDHNENYSPTFPRRLTPKNGPKGISDEDWIKTESWPSWNAAPLTRSKLGGTDITDDTYYDWPQGDINTKPPGDWSQGERNVRRKQNIVGEVPESHLEESNKKPALVSGGNNPGIRRNGHGLRTDVLPSDDGVTNGIPFPDTKLHWDEWFPTQRYGLPDEKWKSNDQTHPFSQKRGPEEEANTRKISTAVEPIFGNHNGIDTNYVGTPSRRWTPSDGGEEKTNESWWLQHSVPRSKWNTEDQHTDHIAPNHNGIDTNYVDTPSRPEKGNQLEKPNFETNLHGTTTESNTWPPWLEIWSQLSSRYKNGTKNKNMKMDHEVKGNVNTDIPKEHNNKLLTENTVSVRGHFKVWKGSLGGKDDGKMWEWKGVHQPKHSFGKQNPEAESLDSVSPQYIGSKPRLGGDEHKFISNVFPEKWSTSTERPFSELHRTSGFRLIDSLAPLGRTSTVGSGQLKHNRWWRPKLWSSNNRISGASWKNGARQATVDDTPRYDDADSPHGSHEEEMNLAQPNEWSSIGH